MLSKNKLVYIVDVKEDIPHAYKAWVELMLRDSKMCSYCKSQKQQFPKGIDLYLDRRIKSYLQSCWEGSGMIFHKEFWRLVRPYLDERVAIGRVFVPSGRSGEWTRRSGEQFCPDKFVESETHVNVTADGPYNGLDLYDAEDGKSRRTGVCRICGEPFINIESTKSYFLEEEWAGRKCRILTGDVLVISDEFRIKTDCGRLPLIQLDPVVLYADPPRGKNAGAVHAKERSKLIAESRRRK